MTDYAASFTRLSRLAAGEACVHCRRFPEEHGPGGKCLFEPTSYRENEALRKAAEQCAEFDQLLASLKTYGMMV